MKKYLIRVELHGKLHDHPDCMELQHNMEHAGFKDHVVGAPDVDLETHAYQLPMGAFYTEADAPILPLRTKVKAIANRVDESNAVLIADCNRLEWSDLTEITHTLRPHAKHQS